MANVYSLYDMHNKQRPLIIYYASYLKIGDMNTTNASKDRLRYLQYQNH